MQQALSLASGGVHEGDLDLTEHPNTIIPEDFHIKGNLTLPHGYKNLPKIIVIDGNLYAGQSEMTRLNGIIGGDACIPFSCKEIDSHSEVGGKFYKWIPWDEEYNHVALSGVFGRWVRIQREVLKVITTPPYSIAFKPQLIGTEAKKIAGTFLPTRV
jgi:hypothetical protein